MKLLLDTCALSELQRPKPNPAVLQLLEAVPDVDLFVSVISLGELIKGITLLSGGKRRHQLERWVQGLEAQFSERILPVDLETARYWAGLTANAKLSGTTLPIADGLIAATALRHGMHLLTRNEKDFACTGAFIINPWDE